MEEACGTTNAVCRGVCVCSDDFYDTNGQNMNGACELGMVI